MLLQAFMPLVLGLVLGVSRVGNQGTKSFGRLFLKVWGWVWFGLLVLWAMVEFWKYFGSELFGTVLGICVATAIVAGCISVVIASTTNESSESEGPQY
jgi:hypothetical protein